MKLIKITQSEFNKFYSFLEEDFCFEERKNKNNELETFKNNNFNPNFIYDNNKLIGYICYWDFDEFIFIEHFAILKDLRNKHLGTKFLKKFIENNNKLILIEVEKPVDEVTTKRINFYKYLGFIINDYNYIQPSYHEKSSNSNIPMLILTYNQPITFDEYYKFIKQIKNIVYT